MLHDSVLCKFMIVIDICDITIGMSEDVVGCC